MVFDIVGKQWRISQSRDYRSGNVSLLMMCDIRYWVAIELKMRNGRACLGGGDNLGLIEVDLMSRIFAFL
ncbi:hypothetical protein PEPS_38200 (plasmid) [Persicobacter psychrovividus]|uniref:Uncharacterized protein n=1 Tax=Persicobacter psychrovividus TaxID=387638 RepID=A0ABM7VKP4_9BACT|nr:hypothetical protein PEPS_38200 [Persicobacter psychrovividus]